MRSLAYVKDIRFAEANATLRSKGLLGWVMCSCGDLQLDCLALRVTQAGEYAMSFPCRTDSNGIMHPYYLPLSEETRQAIQAQVIGELRARGILK